MAKSWKNKLAIWLHCSVVTHTLFEQTYLYALSVSPSLLHRHITHYQCDQIGQFLKVITQSFLAEVAYIMFDFLGYF